jgi:hypothetical protein
MFNENEIILSTDKYKTNDLNLLFVIETLRLGGANQTRWKIIHNWDKSTASILIKELVNKGIVNCINPRNPTWFDIVLTEDFGNNLPQTKEMADELYATYPNTVLIDGRQVELKKGAELTINGVKSYYSKDKLKLMYLEKINYDANKHRKIIDDLKQAIRENRINCAIRSFIIDSMWEDLESTDHSSKKTNEGDRLVTDGF